MVKIFATAPFYTKYVKQITPNDFPSPYIRENPKLWPYFNRALGAIDGSHIHLAAPSSLHKTGKVLHLRTVYSPAPSTSFSHIPLRDGKDLLLMPGFMRVPLVWILAFQMDGIFLQMPVFHTVRNFWFHTAEFGTIFQSGAMQEHGIIFFSLFKKTLTMSSVV